MKQTEEVLGHEKASVERRSYHKKLSSEGLVTGEKHNRCVIFPAKVGLIADSIERKDNTWLVRTQVESDIVIKIGKTSTFHLHTHPIVSRSGYLNRLIFEKRNEKGSPFQLDNFPGGPEIFELIVKFCYGWKFDLTPTNIAPLHCAAHFLEMIDELANGNLISKTETFLTFIILSSWKDTFHILKTCESISSFAIDLQIQTKCTESIAWKVCMDPKDISLALNEEQCLNFTSNDSETLNFRCNVAENWWFEDVSMLHIDHFVEVVASIRKKGMNPKLLGSCIAYWTGKWLTRVSFGVILPTQKNLNNQLRRVMIESLIRVLPVEENSVSCNFLLHLLKVGSMLQIDGGLCEELEKRITMMLCQCRPLDLLVKNYGESETLYDVGIVARVIEACLSSNGESKFGLGRLVDGYLMLVARDKKLPVEDFQLLAEVLPKAAWYNNDNLYKAIDMYLKAHPHVTEEGREDICRAMEYQKLSQEARLHAMKNERLPVNLTAQLVLLEQVTMVNCLTNSGSAYRRTKAQTIISLESERRTDCLKVNREVKMMKKEVESIKIQLSLLQRCKVEIKRMARRSMS